MSGRFVRLCAALVLLAGAQSLALGQSGAPRTPKPAIVSGRSSRVMVENSCIATTAPSTARPTIGQPPETTARIATAASGTAIRMRDTSGLTGGRTAAVA